MIYIFEQGDCLQKVVTLTWESLSEDKIGHKKGHFQIRGAPLGSGPSISISNEDGLHVVRWR